MEVARTAFDDGVDRAARTAAVLCLIVAEQYLDLAYCIKVGCQIRAGHRSRVETRDAVQCQIDRAGASAVEIDSDKIIPAGRFTIRSVHNPGQQLCRTRCNCGL